MSQWSGLYFTAEQRVDPVTGSPTADPDFDGMSNLEEWASGSHPWRMQASPVVGAMTSVGAASYLEITTRRSRSALGLTLQADASSSLGNWSPGAAPLTGTPVDLGDGTEQVTFRHPTPAPAASPQFMRLRFNAN